MFSASLYDAPSEAAREAAYSGSGKRRFVVERTRGSHARMKHPDGRITSVPAHSGETIGPGLLRSILRDLEMTTDDLVKLH